MRVLAIIAPSTVLLSCVFYALYLAHESNLRAEHYRLMYLDAAGLVSEQSQTIDAAQQSMASASSVLETCIQIVRARQ